MISTRRAIPARGDVLLVVEVAEASLNYDRKVKGAVYAANGIGEYRIVNLLDRTLEVRRRPDSSGISAEYRALTTEEAVEIAALPGIGLTVGDFFPSVS